MADAGICEQLKQLHLVEKCALRKEIPGGEYVLHLDSQISSGSDTGALLAASSSDCNVHLYSRDSLAYHSTISGHTKIITGVKFCQNDPHLLYTSSSDGSIRCWDLRTKRSEAAVIFEGDESSHVFKAFDVSCDGRTVCAGTDTIKEDVHLIFWDTRTKDRLQVYSESHQDDITQVSFSPSVPSKLMTSSMDGLVCLFDVSQPCEDDAILTTMNCECSVLQVGWCGHNSSRMYGITSISTFHLWDALKFDTILEVTDIKSDQVVRGVNYLVDCFQTSQDELHLLAGSFRGDMYILRVMDSGVQQLTTIPIAHSGIIRCISWDKTTESLVTGGEDSMLCMWKSEQDKTSDSDNKKRKSKSPPPKVKKMKTS